MSQEPTPNFDEHIKPIHPKGGILSAWAELPSPIADFRKKILFAQLNKIDEEIMDYLTASHKNLETLNPVKMGKKKMQAEIERLRDVLEMVEDEKKQTEQAHLGKDLESVVKILGKYGNVVCENKYENPQFIKSGGQTITITLNC
jgi:regulator of replication initiation timing